VTGGDADRGVRADVADVLVRYATGIDRRDWALFRTCFTDGCEADYGDTGTFHGVDELTDWMQRAHELCGHTLHRITNVSVDTGNDDSARARSYVDALVMGPDNQSGMRVNGFYDDELVHTDTGWRIARRRYTTVYMELVGAGITF
jgi:3-phenylpropionate/cinnamic acid dioxygenase small subunit